jgi:ferredoxin-NADP reductase
MGFIKDIMPIFQKHKLIFKEKRTEAGDIVTFIFEGEDKLWWEAGRHGIISVKTASGKTKGKPFSVASTPEEGKVIISTRVPENPSEYKKALNNLQVGDSVTMSGPIGPFHYDDRIKPALLIAGGVGITPIRSIIFSTALNKKDSQATMQLLYIDSKNEFLYEEDFNSIAGSDDFLKVGYLTDREQLTMEIEAYIREFGNHSYYFVTGSSKMVKSIKRLLKSKGVVRKNIKSDIFFGY